MKIKRTPEEYKEYRKQYKKDWLKKKYPHRSIEWKEKNLKNSKESMKRARLAAIQLLGGRCIKCGLH